MDIRSIQSSPASGNRALAHNGSPQAGSRHDIGRSTRHERERRDRSQRMAVMAVAALAGALLFAWGKPAAATQHWNLSDGLPTTVEDAFARGAGGLEVQVFSRWNSRDEGRDQWELTPRFVWGVGDRVEVRAGGTALIGGNRTGSGDLRGEALWQISDPGAGWTPAFATLLAFDLPTGRDTRGIDTTLKLIGTSTLGPPQAMQRVHFNLGYRENDRPRPGERGSLWQYGVGYSQPFGQTMTFVADLIREEGRRGGVRGTIAEAGVRWHLAGATVASLGFGIGSGSAMPDYRVMAGIQFPM
jgi:hypothetical protein